MGRQPSGHVCKGMYNFLSDGHALSGFKNYGLYNPRKWFRLHGSEIFGSFFFGSFFLGSELFWFRKKRFIFLVRKCGQVWFRNHARSEKHHALWVPISVFSVLIHHSSAGGCKRPRRLQEASEAARGLGGCKRPRRPQEASEAARGLGGCKRPRICNFAPFTKNGTTLSPPLSEASLSLLTCTTLVFLIQLHPDTRWRLQW